MKGKRFLEMGLSIFDEIQRTPHLSSLPEDDKNSYIEALSIAQKLLESGYKLVSGEMQGIMSCLQKD